ncbi:MAG: acyl carrier protein [Acidobacteriaceae bacterium]|nr:acyl carrier protein [Acidobacteriaceae bacterium]
MRTAKERLFNCFSAVFPQLNENEIQKASPSSVGSWDSVSTLILMDVIEEEFGVSLPPEELDQLLSFNLILDYLRSQNGVS